MKLLTLTALLIATAGCSGLVDPTIAVNGAWHVPNEVMGSSFVFTLASHEATVEGSGRWSAEACCAGTLTVTGTTDGPEVTLHFVRSPGQPMTVVASMPDWAHIVGTGYVANEAPFPITFAR